MLKHIEDLQKKPEHVRRRTLYVVVSILMLIIIFVWVSTLGVRFTDNKKEANGNASDVSPVEVLKDRANTFYDNFGEGVGNIKEQFSR